ncbi:cytosine/adenosine deaminase-related metal-dependent hydrolase [Methanohalophilus levihalophilus]|uniref:amidohydrolase family protein n=1 Tax=Methanohalophilus levihalophilus TaxID=1431282 RepID=UPI001AE32FB2|nr:amidohydrolase family protein [Methanohalophilus levihalophilus]MBP2031083.1 cytosine/adenosine deaminase-related metal-dependent hydrolase [Methanohalophilus levihalophilus]
MPSKSCEQVIYGKILYGEELSLLQGYVCVKDGVIHEVVEEQTNSENILIPGFVNSHTHIGDSVCKDPCLGQCENFVVKPDLDTLVKPPDGLKHRILSETSFEHLVSSMRLSILDMLATGTTAFADFRESGVNGVAAIKEALADVNIRSRILGRPSGCNTSPDALESEIAILLSEADGLGMSGANDMDMAILEQASSLARKKHKIFAIHAAEKSRIDLENALSLDPGLLIHLTQADKTDLKAVSSASIPVAVCPRSNFITGVGMAPIQDMLSEGISVSVGTDNVMLNSVNMFSEMEFLSKVFKLDDRQVFKMCTLNGASNLGFTDIGPIKEGFGTNIVVLNGSSNNLQGIRDIIGGVVRRARPDDILSVIN